MKQANGDFQKPSKIRNILAILWGFLPYILLGLILLIAIRMFAAVGEESAYLKSRKKGLENLKGMERASEQLDQVLATIRKSKDARDAAQKLQKDLGFSEDQTKEILGLSLISLTMGEKEKLKTHIARLETEISENNENTKSSEEILNVVTLAMEPGVIQDRLNLVGVVQPWLQVSVNSQVSGKVTDKRIEKGQTITKGDVIAVLDARDYRNTVKSLKAEFDAASSSLKRLKKLKAGKLSTQSEYDSVQARVRALSSSIANAQLAVERTIISAPISGILNTVYFEKGELLNPGDKVVEIIQLDRLKINVGIPESDVAAVRSIYEFSVTIDALDGAMFTARNHFVSNTADPMARLYNLELALENKDGLILPDMFVRVEIIKKTIPDSLSLPLFAVLNRGDKYIAYAVNDGKAHEREVDLGLQEGWRVQINNGLVPGDQVIVVGQRTVTDDQPVTVVRSITNIQELLQ
ncbi:efflux RND transporter periplasmic adaptor subunit [Desulfobacterales bacterium HSG17]|nr:efflux RND transporter periplasmic adaptor subunit [Desulfobacterales bacterium HSG17]